MADSTMTDERMLEIALMMEAARYRALGTERYMAELKTFGLRNGVPDGEMFQFYTRIFEKMRPASGSP